MSFSDFAWTILFLCCLLLLRGLVFFQYYAKRLAGKNVSEMTYFVSSGMSNFNSICLLDHHFFNLAYRMHNMDV